MKFLAVLLALALPPAIYFPTLGARHAREIARLQSDLRDVEMHLEQAKSAQRKLSQFHEEVIRLAQEVLKLRAILPPAMRIDDIRATTEATAQENGVKVTRFDPRPPFGDEDVQGQWVDATVVGSAEKTLRFFLAVANATRIIDVRYVTLRPDPSGWRTDFLMEAYAQPEGR